MSHSDAHSEETSTLFHTSEVQLGETIQAILAEIGRNKGDRLLVGFAAETQNMVEEARRKMESICCSVNRPVCFFHFYIFRENQTYCGLGAELLLLHELKLARVVHDKL